MASCQPSPRAASWKAGSAGRAVLVLASRPNPPDGCFSQVAPGRGWQPSPPHPFPRSPFRASQPATEEEELSAGAIQDLFETPAYMLAGRPLGLGIACCFAASVVAGWPPGRQA